MPDYTAPGVFVDDLNPHLHSIDDVSTSTAGMVGESERGPLAPQLITSWAGYTRWYGDYTDRGGPQPSPDVYLPYAVRGFFENGGRRLYVARAAGAGSSAARGTLPGVHGDTTIEACGPGDWGNRIVITITRSSPEPDLFSIRTMYYREGATSGGPSGREPDVLEEFNGLTADCTLPNYAGTILNGASRLVRIIECLSSPAEAPWPGIALAGGSSEPAEATDYRAALAGLGENEEVSLWAIPGAVVVPTLDDALIDHCEQLRDRFAVLSGPAGQLDAAQIHPPRDTSYGAFYYPWLRVPAPHTPNGTILVPPCGHILGLIARVEQSRGVAKAPANEVLRGLSNADPLQVAISNSEQDSLNSRGVNVVRDFRATGRGIRVWGSRTMSSAPEWRYINVRRLCIFLERSIARGTRWAVFEPNSERTWASIRASVHSFLGMVWRDGALHGNREEQAFFVQCDRTTMTQDDIDNGRLICLIGVAPVKAAEFVLIHISHRTLGAES